MEFHNHNSPHVHRKQTTAFYDSRVHLAEAAQAIDMDT
jgi:hypothetical protein